MRDNLFSTVAHVVLIFSGCANSTNIPFTECTLKSKILSSVSVRKCLSNCSPRGDYTANCPLSSLVCAKQSIKGGSVAVELSANDVTQDIGHLRWGFGYGQCGGIHFLQGVLMIFTVHDDYGLAQS